MKTFKLPDFAAMLYSFFLQLIMMVSLGAIVYIFASAVPRIEDEEEISRQHGFWERLVKKIPLDRIDNSFNLFLQKTFRHIKVFLMKMDNLVTSRLDRLKNVNGQNGKKEKNDLFSSE